MKKAIIIGAGPAGLTAAYELLTKTDIVPIIIEADKQVGGLSKTIDYKGNKIDIGGHRFFSKSEKVISWWLNFLPLDPAFNDDTVQLQYQNKKKDFVIPNQNPEPGVNASAAGSMQKIKEDRDVMLVRKRKSRVYYHKMLFDYPLQLSFRMLRSLGFIKSVKICLSYLKAKMFPIKPEENLEQFFRNRFGTELYETFFKDYTEKVWGVPCNQIPASWGHQRVKNLNVGKLVWHALRSIFTSNTRLDQKGTSTSLIEQFLYPKYGPGQMWEKVAEEIERLGGEIHLNTQVTGIVGDGGQRIVAVNVSRNSKSPTNLENIHGKEINARNGEEKLFSDAGAGSKVEEQTLEAGYFISTMPVKQLFDWSINLPVPENIRSYANALEYRDFLIVGILADELTLREKDGSPVTDNWIYVQDKGIKAGRIQLFHNWSPYMVADSNKSWIGVEYFCNENDPFWMSSDPDVASLAISEMEKIGVLKKVSVRDHFVARVRKAYPSYYGAYANFSSVQSYLNSIVNLFPIGRNGMHRYNNSDHSMLTAMAAVENIISGNTDKTSIWEINTEDEYHEEKTS